MSEDKKQDYTPNPDGSIKTVHATIEMFKMKAKHGIGKSGYGPKIVFETSLGETKTEKLPEAKFEGNALKVPANKKVKEALEGTDWDEGMEATITYKMEGGYWGIIDMVEGHVGRSGVIKADENGNIPDQDQSSSNASTGASGGGYNPVGPIAGQLFNLATTIAEKTLTKSEFSLDKVEEIALENLDQFLAIKERLESKVKAGMKNSKPEAKESKPKTEIKETGKAKADPDVSDEDDGEFE